LAYVNLTDAFFKQRFYQFQWTVRPAHADAPYEVTCEAPMAAFAKSWLKGDELPLSSGFLGAQADFCPGRAYRMASSQACVLLIASRHLDTGSSLSGFVSASQRRQTASQASDRSGMSSGRLISISRRTGSR